MELKNKKVLVTGAGGFIGSHLTERLIDYGCNVRAFVRYNSSGNIGNLKKLPLRKLKEVEIHQGNLKNVESIKKASKNIDCIFHLGAMIAIPYSYIDPRDYVETNILGTLNVLESAKEFGTERILLTSTSEVYGTAIYSPINELHPLQAQSPYSASKISADKIGESYYNSFDLPIVTVRPFNTYGPRQSTRAIIPTIISQALTSETIQIGSLSPKRDFTYVEDTAEGFIKLAEAEGVIGKVINIGSGKTVSIGELERKIEKILGRNYEVITDERRIRPERSEVKLLLCDNTLAKKLALWEPVTSLERGLKKTIEYVKKNIKEYTVGGYHL